MNIFAGQGCDNLRESCTKANNLDVAVKRRGGQGNANSFPRGIVAIGEINSSIVLFDCRISRPHSAITSAQLLGILGGTAMSGVTVKAYYETYWPAVLEIADDPQDVIRHDTERLLAITGQEASDTELPTFPLRLLNKTCGTTRDF